MCAVLLPPGDNPIAVNNNNNNNNNNNKEQRHVLIYHQWRKRNPALSHRTQIESDKIPYRKSSFRGRLSFFYSESCSGRVCPISRCQRKSYYSHRRQCLKFRTVINSFIHFDTDKCDSSYVTVHRNAFTASN
jgi:hypothetical protein